MLDFKSEVDRVLFEEHIQYITLSLNYYQDGRWRKICTARISIWLFKVPMEKYSNRPYVSSVAHTSSHNCIPKIVYLIHVGWWNLGYLFVLEHGALTLNNATNINKWSKYCFTFRCGKKNFFLSLLLLFLYSGLFTKFIQ